MQRSAIQAFVVPAHAGTHDHRRFNFLRAGATYRLPNQPLWLWVPAFAGTTKSALLRRRHRAAGNVRAGAVALVDIVDHHRLEFGGDIGTAQGAEFLAVD